MQFANILKSLIENFRSTAVAVSMLFWYKASKEEIKLECSGVRSELLYLPINYSAERNEIKKKKLKVRFTVICFKLGCG